MEYWFPDILSRINYLIYIILILVGLHAMISKNNLVKKIIGMNIFQTAIILFFISTGSKRGATLPILHHGGHNGHEIMASHYINPLPHVLMLTAIVVSVATLGVALALAIRVYQRFGTLEEDEIRKKIQEDM